MITMMMRIAMVRPNRHFDDEDNDADNDDVM